MSTIVYFYKNPLTWFVLLVLIQVWVAVIMSPSSQQEYAQTVAYETALASAKNDPQLTEFIESQNASLNHKQDVIVALTDMQKYLGGLTAIGLLIFLLLTYRKERIEQQ
jgi:hypothetical protein